MSEARSIERVQPEPIFCTAFSPVGSVMQEFVRDLRTAKYSPRTIGERVAMMERLRIFLDDKPLFEADEDDLRRFQRSFAHLAPTTMDLYVRHVQSFYRWAVRRRFIPRDPSTEMVLPRLPRRRAHPMTIEELRLILATAPAVLRLVFVLAAFAGLRRGEICRLRRQDIDITGPVATAFIVGKGGHERIVPLLAPVVAELHRYGLPRTGYIVLKNGVPYSPAQLSLDSHYFLKSIGVETTLHSGRHWYCTHVAQMTKDVLLVKDLAGHQDLSTTMGYMASDLSDAHARLSGFAGVASGLLGQDTQPLRVVR